MEPTPWASVAVTAWIDCGLAICTGCIFGVRSVASTSHLQVYLHRLHRTAKLASLTIFLCLLAHLYLFTGSMVGSLRPAEILQALPSIVETHAGLMDTVGALAALILCIAAFGVFFSISVRKGLFLAAMEVLLLCRSATGHAANQGNFTILELLQLGHLVGTFVWSGAVIVCGLLLAPAVFKERSLNSSALLRSLSATSTWALLLVLLTGAIKSYKGVDGQLSMIPVSLWGRILLFKLCVVAVVVLLGALHFRLIRSSGFLTDSHVPSRLRKTLALEGVLMLLVLAISAWLATTSPPAD